MHQILTWPLNNTDKLVWCSDQDSLDTVTGCSKFMVFLLTEKHMFSVFSCSGACIITLYKQMEALLAGKQLSVDYQQKLQVSVDGQLVACLVCCDQQIGRYLIDQGQWSVFVKQLELLAIVILENENEKRERGSRCC